MASTKPLRLSSLACCAIVALAGARLASAQAPAAVPAAPPAAPPAPPAKPLAVVAINSYESLLEDADYLVSLLNMPGFPRGSEIVQGMVANFTGGKGLAGLDTTKPIGVLVDMSMMFPNVAAYLPVTDQAALLSVLQPMGITSRDAGNGVTQFSIQGQDGYAKNQNGWTLVGMSPEGLSAMPADPTPALTPLASQYDVALQFNVQSLPEGMRQAAAQSIAQAQGSLTKLPSESDEDFQQRVDGMQGQVESSQRMLQELDQVTIGLAISAEAKKAHLDVNMLAMPGSKMAQELTENAESTTNFAGFIQPDAAATLNFAGKVTGTNAEQMQQMIGTLRARLTALAESHAASEMRGPIRTAFAEVIDAILETVKAGKIDGGAVVQLSPKSATVVAGGLIADPSKIENALKALAESFKNSGSVKMPEIKWNAAKHGDITLHTMTVAVTDPKAQATFGNSTEVVVGLGAHSAYVAWGTTAMESLTSVIDASAAKPGTAVPPVELTVALGQVLEYARSVVPAQRKANLEMISSVVAGSAGQDHFHLIAQPIENGTQVRFEVEQGVLQAAATSAMMRNMSPPPQGAPAPPP